MKLLWHPVPFALMRSHATLNLCARLKNPTAGLYPVLIAGAVKESGIDRWTGPVRVESIERLLHWRGKRGRLVAALLAEGFLRDEGETIIAAKWEDVIHVDWRASTTTHLAPDAEAAESAHSPDAMPPSDDADTAQDWTRDARKKWHKRNPGKDCGVAGCRRCASHVPHVPPVSPGDIPVVSPPCPPGTLENVPPVSPGDIPVVSPALEGGKGGVLLDQTKTETQTDTQARARARPSLKINERKAAAERVFERFRSRIEPRASKSVYRMGQLETILEKFYSEADLLLAIDGYSIPYWRDKATWSKVFGDHKAPSTWEDRIEVGLKAAPVKGPSLASPAWKPPAAIPESERGVGREALRKMRQLAVVNGD